jgi:hypothetical protein
MISNVRCPTERRRKTFHFRSSRYGMTRAATGTPRTRRLSRLKTRAARGYMRISIAKKVMRRMPATGIDARASRWPLTHLAQSGKGLLQLYWHDACLIHRRVRCGVTINSKQCSVLLVNDGSGCSQRAALESSGFLVTETGEWPEDETAILSHHIVIIRIRSIRNAPMIAARLRAKPRFGRRVVIGLIPQSTPLRERTAALTSGFDDVLNDSCDSRQLIARILKRLRMVPEYHCLLPRRVA